MFKIHSNLNITVSGNRRSGGYFAKFGLELALEKTKILEFGRFAKHNREKRGLGKPETFDFLGFIFYCSENGKKEFFRCTFLEARGFTPLYRRIATFRRS